MRKLTEFSLVAVLAFVAGYELGEKLRETPAKGNWTEGEDHALRYKYICYSGEIVQGTYSVWKKGDGTATVNEGWRENTNFTDLGSAQRYVERSASEACH
jgi:hypothetical protein